MKKTLAVILVILLLFSLAGCSRFTVSGMHSVKYNGTLKTFVNRDYSDLREFVLYGSIDDFSEDTTSIICKDCHLERGNGYGVADIFEVVFFEEGLVEVDKNAEYYVRFRDDYVFAIKFDNGESYYFVSYNDAWEWIQERY